MNTKQNFTPRTTPAPTLNGDVLLNIFQHLKTNRSRRLAALVCRAWTTPAQTYLYKYVCFIGYPDSNLDSGPDPDDDLPYKRFARTMRSCPHLRSLVRYLSVRTHGDDSAEALDWLCLLPEFTLSRFRYLWETEDAFDPSVLNALAVRSVTHFIAHGPQSTAILAACLSLPRLETLEVSMDECDETSDWEIDAALAPNLRQLTLRTYLFTCPIAISLFTAFAPQLVSFRLHALFHMLLPHHEWEEAILTHGTRLKHLVLSGAVSWNKRGLPFLDAFVRKARSLEQLRCMAGTFTGALFHHLPPRLRVLEVYCDVAHQHPMKGVRDFLCGIKTGEYAKASGLRTVKLVLPPKSSGWPQLEAEIEEECDAAGIRCEQVRDELYGPARYMHEEAVVRTCFMSDFGR